MRHSTLQIFLFLFFFSQYFVIYFFRLVGNKIRERKTEREVENLGYKSKWEVGFLVQLQQPFFLLYHVIPKRDVIPMLPAYPILGQHIPLMLSSNASDFINQRCLPEEKFFVVAARDLAVLVLVRKTLSLFLPFTSFSTS